MLTFEERDDVTIQNPPADKVVLFYTDGALRLKDETGEVSTLATTEGLEAEALATEPKVYVALLSQSGTDAPVATILKNTLGGVPVWSYLDAGSYILTLTGAFSGNVSQLNNLVDTALNETNKRIIAGSKLTNDTYEVKFYDDISAPSKADNALNHIIKIEVYP